MPDFDIIGTNAGGQRQGTPVFNTVPVAGQSQQPMSPLMAGILGVPTTTGAIPGAAYAVQGQGQGQQQAQQASGLLAGILGLNSSGGQAGATTSQQPIQAQNVGSGLRNLFDGVVYGAQSRDV